MLYTENTDLALEILKFLFFHGFFVANQNPSKKPKGTKPRATFKLY